jgi:hypothetical protein
VSSNIHLTAYCPGHIDRPPVPLHGHRGIHNFDGIPTLPEWILRECEAPVCERQRRKFNEDEDKLSLAIMADICQRVKARAAETYGGVWSTNLD